MRDVLRQRAMYARDDLHVLLRHRLLLQRRVRRPVADLDPEAIGVEEEHRPVARLVTILLRREVDTHAEVQAAPVGLIDLLSPLDEHREVLDAHVVVAVLPTVGPAQTDALPTEAQIHDLLATAIARVPDLLGRTERSENREV